MLVYVVGGKLEYPEKNPRNKDENQQQQQTQPTYAAGHTDRRRVTIHRNSHY